MTRPVRIGLIDNGGRHWIGGSMYTKNLILALASLPESLRSTFEICLLYQSQSDFDTGQALKSYVCDSYDLAQMIKPVNFKNRLIWKMQKILFQESHPPFLPVFKQGKLDFLYPVFEPSLARSPHQSCPWIPDFQHKYLPHLFSSEEIKQRDRDFATIARQSTRVVLSSQTAETDFKTFYPTSKTKTEVLHFRTSSAPEWYQWEPTDIQRKYHLPDRFFVLSGQFWQHKNHLVVLEALKILQASDLYPIVVCTGHTYDHRKPDYNDQILYHLHTYNLASQFFMLGLIARTDQIQLMRRAMAIIQPSLFEGWSTVVEDARCLGKTMILSDFPVHVEQNPPGAIFFGCTDPQALADAIAKSWRTLRPGPDLAQEAHARAQNKQDIQALGYRFLQLIRPALVPSPPNP
jgi:glycosyltransferase involved in cell wall biosynthesis